MTEVRSAGVVSSLVVLARGADTERLAFVGVAWLLHVWRDLTLSGWGRSGASICQLEALGMSAGYLLSGG